MTFRKFSSVRGRVGLSDSSGRSLTARLSSLASVRITALRSPRSTASFSLAAIAFTLGAYQWRTSSYWWLRQ